MLLIKFPSRSRPERFLEVLTGWVRNASDLNDLHFLFSFDHDDPTMVGMGDRIKKMGIKATTVYSYSNSKVEAINRDFEHVEEPWDAVLVLSDDMHCVHKDWDDEIRKQVQANPDALIWFPDQKQREMCTLPCMGRSYYDRFGWIYDPRFKSVFCDDLQTDLAKQADRLVLVDLCIAHHLHPANVNNLAPDSLYRRNETTAIWKHDEALYRQLTPYPR